MLMSLVLSRATELLDQLKPPTPEMPQVKLMVWPLKTTGIFWLADTAFFAELDKDQLPALIAYGELQLFASNDVILEEGEDCDDLIILFTGSVETSFSMMIDGQHAEIPHHCQAGGGIDLGQRPV